MDLPRDPRNEGEYEQTHVHSVYNSIASHFSQTRYKPWPIVERFLKNLAPGSIGLDIGCGNGKYLTVRDDVYIMGSDRSDELVKIAKHHERHDALVGDALDPPHPPGRFDFAISIAVLHHLSTRERRIEGVRAALARLKVPDSSSTNKQEAGQALFFVWALEQKGSRRGWDEGGEQDVLVPWVLKPPAESSRQGKSEKSKQKGRKGRSDIAADRRHNAQNQAQLQGEQNSTGESGVHGTKSSDGTTQQTPRAGTDDQQHGEKSEEQVYHRYYHLYRQGELEEDVTSAGGEVVQNGYDRDNWWCIARKNPHKPDQFR